MADKPSVLYSTRCTLQLFLKPIFYFGVKGVHVGEGQRIGIITVIFDYHDFNFPAEIYEKYYFITRDTYGVLKQIVRTGFSPGRFRKLGSSHSGKKIIGRCFV